MGKYIIGVDQSTQGTKALLFDDMGDLVCRADRAHRQLVNEKGWVSHSPEEIYENFILVIKEVIEKASISPAQVVGLGISNQRETSVIWDRYTGKSLCDAIVWQCARAAEICERKEIEAKAELLVQKTGLKLSPYFPAAKIAWLLENVKDGKKKSVLHSVCYGTMDSYLVYKLTKGRVYATDYLRIVKVFLRSQSPYRL